MWRFCPRFSLLGSACLRGREEGRIIVQYTQGDWYYPVSAAPCSDASLLLLFGNMWVTRRFWLAIFDIFETSLASGFNPTVIAGGEVASNRDAEEACKYYFLARRLAAENGRRKAQKKIKTRRGRKPSTTAGGSPTTRIHLCEDGVPRVVLRRTDARRACQGARCLYWEEEWDHGADVPGKAEPKL